MLSVSPQLVNSQYQNKFFRPLVNWWELALPRVFMAQPASARSCWLINKYYLKQSGGFAAVSRSMFPERHFSKRLKASRQYRFLRSNNSLGLYSVKSARGQIHSALRLRYFQANRRPDSVLLIGAGEIVFLIAPFIFMLVGFFAGQPSLFILSSAACVIIVLSHLIIEFAYTGKLRFKSFFNFPFLAIIEVYLIHASMWRYEFGEVVWKGRNICLPVLNTLPKLPKID
jgi:hypothetical protein